MRKAESAELRAEDRDHRPNILSFSNRCKYAMYLLRRAWYLLVHNYVVCGKGHSLTAHVETHSSIHVHDVILSTTTAPTIPRHRNLQALMVTVGPIAVG